MIDVSVHLTGNEVPSIRPNEGKTRPFVVVEVAGVSIFLKDIAQAKDLSDAYAEAASALMAMTDQAAGVRGPDGPKAPTLTHLSIDGPKAPTLTPEA